MTNLRSISGSADVAVVHGAGSGLRLFGIPVRFDPGLVVLLVVLATTVHASPAELAAFIGGGVTSIVAHELGHAVVSRYLGASDVSISVTAYGGLTRYRLPSPSRLRQGLISVAGPAVGLLLGAAVWLVKAANPPVHGSTTDNVYRELLLVTVGWSLLNLLPVLPLDGGRLVEHILPGSAQDRSRGAAVLSLVVGAITCRWFWRHHDEYSSVVFALLVVYSALVAVRGAAPGGTHRHNDSCRVFIRASAGDYADALRLAGTARKLHPALKALPAAVLDGDQAAARQLWRLYDQRPNDVMTRSCMVLWRAHIRDWAGVLGMLRAGNIKQGACRAALAGAYQAGAFDEAASIGEAVLRGHHNPTFAYNTACCWARAGNSELALRALMRAVDYGWSGWERMDRDEDLESVREMPAFQAWRLTLAA